MSWRFRKSVALPFLGLQLNIGKAGVSVSLPVMPGLTVNAGKKGVQVTGGLPGTGLSTTHKLSPAKRK